MKKIIFLLLDLMLAITLFAQKKLIDDPNAELRKLSGSFHAIEVSNAVDVYLNQGNEEAIAVSASDKADIGKIVTEVENGLLKIGFQNTGKIGWHMKNRKLKAYLSFKNIDKIAASGASDLFLEGELSGNSLDMHLTGASDMKGGTLKLDNLNIDLSGASDIMIAGVANTVSIKASGASDVKAFDLVADNCTAHASGASDIKITVNKELNVHASGASDIHYKGTAVIKNLQSSGASTVSKKD